MKNESYVLKAAFAPEKEEISILVNGTIMYSEKLTDFINDLIKISKGADVPLVLAALELQIRGLRSLLTKEAFEVAEEVGKAITVSAVGFSKMGSKQRKMTNEGKRT